MSDYHEPVSSMSTRTLDFVRALATLKEEIEAIIWYQQRIDATSDESLAEILEHNRQEEIEHASMALEWLRRKDPEWDRILHQYVFTAANIVEIEEAEEEAGDSNGAENRANHAPIGRRRPK